LAALPARAQEQADSCLRRTVFANVVDAQGFPIAGFDASHFRASFRGKPVQILSAQMESAPRRIIVLLDVSGSMLVGAGKWDLARRAAGDLVAMIPAENSVAFLTFGDQVYDRTEFSRIPKQSLEKVNDLMHPRKAKSKVGGRTALFDALQEALATFGTTRPGDTIYLVTDGGANGGKVRQKEAERALLASGTRVFAFILQPDQYNRHTPEELEGLHLVEELAQLTGGNFIDVSSRFYSRRDYQEGVDVAARRMYQEMIAFYRLEIELMEEVDKPRAWDLALVPGSGVKAKELRLNYPKKLLPCPAAAAK
jgi:Mg-chelatase subunit ChlD